MKEGEWMSIFHWKVRCCPFSTIKHHLMRHEQFPRVSYCGLFWFKNILSTTQQWPMNPPRTNIRIQQLNLSTTDEQFNSCWILSSRMLNKETSSIKKTGLWLDGHLSSNKTLTWALEDATISQNVRGLDFHVERRNLFSDINDPCALSKSLDKRTDELCMDLETGL